MLSEVMVINNSPEPSIICKIETVNPRYIHGFLGDELIYGKST